MKQFCAMKEMDSLIRRRLMELVQLNPNAEKYRIFGKNYYKFSGKA